jgi:hypothetical protein
MVESDMGPVEGPLLRARLHIRGGKRRLRQGKIAAGIVTLYDALEGAMLSYLEQEGNRRRLAIRDGDDLNNSAVLYRVLVRSGVLDGSFDFDAFDRLTVRALDRELPDYDYRPLVAALEPVMIRLGVLPFDESSLPPEDPSTY